MNWVLTLVIIFSGLCILMGSGMLVAMAFFITNIFGVYFFWGGEAGLKQLVFSMAGSVSTFSLVAVPLFVLMGDVMFHSGIAPNMLDAVDKWLGRLPGRLALLAVAAGTLFAALTGASMASTAMLGKSLVPEMEKRGYKKPMSLGPILGAGGLAVMIPPSSMAVVLGAIGEISTGKILIAIIVPGLLMSVSYCIYIIGRCWLQPSLAPVYAMAPVSLSEKVAATVKYILPAGIVVFLVIGVILLGVATPSEAAATGTFGMFLLALLYRRLTWEVVKKSLTSTLQITVMLFIIIAGAQAFGQILAFSGATKGLAQWTIDLPIAPIFVIFAMQVVLLILGCFMNQSAIMMITLPLFAPVVRSLGFNDVWFAAIYLLNMEMASATPPFGLGLFTMKGVAPADTTMADIYKAAMPFIYINFIVMCLMLAFPPISLWLPGIVE